MKKSLEVVRTQSINIMLIITLSVLISGCKNSNFGDIDNNISNSIDEPEENQLGENIDYATSDGEIEEMEVPYKKLKIPFQFSSSYILDTRNGLVYSNNEWSESGSGGSLVYNDSLSKLKLVQITSTIDNSIGITEDGYVYAWGTINESGGDGHAIAHEFDAPTQLDGPENIIETEIGIFQYLALSKEGFVWSWGQNDFGELGYKGNANFKPRKIHNLANIKWIKTILYDSYAVDEDGHLYYWGQIANLIHRDEDGLSSETTVYDPIMFDSLTNVVDIFQLETKRYILVESGDLYRWDPTYEVPHNITKVDGLSNIVEMRCGTGVLMALDDTGQVFCFGENYWGEVGNGTTESQDIPYMIENIDKIVKIEHFYGTSYSIDEKGYLWFWGRSYDKEKNYQLFPYKFEQFSDVQSISCFGEVMIYVDSEYRLWQFGRIDGELSDDIRLVVPLILELD